MPGEQEQTPQEDSLAAKIEQIAAEGKARQAENKARILLADANDSRELGSIKARKVLVERARARTEKLEKEKAAAKAKGQQGGQKQPEPKDIMSPPSGLDSNDQRLDPSSLPGGAIGGAGAQQVLSQLVGGEGPGAAQIPGAGGLPQTVRSAETTTGIGQGQGFGGRSIFFPDTQTRTRERELTPSEMQSAQFAKMQGEAAAQVPISVRAGARNISPFMTGNPGQALEDLRSETRQLLETMRTTTGGLFGIGGEERGEEFRIAWQNLQVDWLDTGQVIIREPGGTFSGATTEMVDISVVERWLVEAQQSSKSPAARELRRLGLQRGGENEHIKDIILQDRALRLGQQSPNAEAAVEQRRKRKEEIDQAVAESESLWSRIVGG